MSESKENRGQEKEAADLTKIISMFMDPSYVWERILLGGEKGPNKALPDLIYYKAYNL